MVVYVKKKKTFDKYVVKPVLPFYNDSFTSRNNCIFNGTTGFTRNILITQFYLINCIFS